MRLVIGLVVVVAMAGIARADSESYSPGPPGMTSMGEEPEDVTEIQRIMGPPVAFTLGFGLGHVVEGRWHEKGWIFTAGETAGMALWIGGLMTDMSCTKHCELVEPMAITGMLGVVALRIWESVDAVNGARRKHARFLDHHARYGLHIGAPRGGGGGAVAGLSLRF